MARANPLWGATRIHGELLKLGIDISEQTVPNLMLLRTHKPPSKTKRTLFKISYASHLFDGFFHNPHRHLQDSVPPGDHWLLTMICKFIKLWVNKFNHWSMNKLWLSGWFRWVYDFYRIILTLKIQHYFMRLIRTFASWVNSGWFMVPANPSQTTKTDRQISQWEDSDKIKSQRRNEWSTHGSPAADTFETGRMKVQFGYLQQKYRINLLVYCINPINTWSCLNLQLYVNQ